MDRPAGYLLHKYLRDPYYLNPVKTRRRNKSPCSYEVGEQLTTCPKKVALRPVWVARLSAAI